MTFVGESGVDLGGPKREFFRLFIKELSQSGFMLGGKNKFFSSNVQAIQVSSKSIFEKLNTCLIHRRKTSCVLDGMLASLLSKEDQDFHCCLIAYTNICVLGRPPILK